MIPYYQKDDCVIYWGDCLEVMPHIERADLLVTDPPYSLSVDHDHENRPGKGTRRLNFFAGDQDWNAMTNAVANRVQMAANVPGVHAAYVWCGHRQFGRFVQDLEDDGYKTRFLVWEKACPVPAPPGVGWDSAAELCIYGFRQGRKWTPPTGTQCPNVLKADSYRHGQPGKVSHPTQKPLVTAVRPILFSSEPGDTVLDPFMGSGTTLVAARDAGRKAIGIEIEERYCEIAAKRLAQGVLPFASARAKQPERRAKVEHEPRLERLP